MRLRETKTAADGRGHSGTTGGGLGLEVGEDRPYCGEGKLLALLTRSHSYKGECSSTHIANKSNPHSKNC